MTSFPWILSISATIFSPPRGWQSARRRSEITRFNFSLLFVQSLEHFSIAGQLVFYSRWFLFHVGWFISGRKWGLILGLLHGSHFGATVTETGNCFNRRRLPPFFFFFRASAASVEVLSIRWGCLCSPGGSASVVLCFACLWCVKDCWVVCVEGMVGRERDASCSGCRAHVARVSHCAKQEVGCQRAQLSEILLTRFDGQSFPMHLIWSRRNLLF